jgi:hypothetical protein
VENFMAEGKIKVRVIQRCFVGNAMCHPGDEIEIPEHLFSASVFERIAPAPVLSEVAPAPHSIMPEAQP